MRVAACCLRNDRTVEEIRFSGQTAHIWMSYRKAVFLDLFGDNWPKERSRRLMLEVWEAQETAHDWRVWLQETVKWEAQWKYLTDPGRALLSRYRGKEEFWPWPVYWRMVDVRQRKRFVSEKFSVWNNLWQRREKCAMWRKAEYLLTGSKQGPKGPSYLSRLPIKNSRQKFQGKLTESNVFHKNEMQRTCKVDAKVFSHWNS